MQRKLLLNALPALYVLWVLATSTPAPAQFRYRPANQYPFIDSIDAPMTYGGYTEGPGFFYTGGIAPSDAPEEQVAYVHVRVSPPHAEISFEGSKTSQIGTSRLYMSPPLVQGQNYTYDIRVSWNDNGQVVTKERKIMIRAGDRLSVAFRRDAASATQASDAGKP